jgi:hypothetical protein
MRHFTLTTGLAIAFAAMFSMTASAEMGGPSQDGKGNCRMFNGNSQNSFYSYWDKCPKPAAAVVTHKPKHKG